MTARQNYPATTGAGILGVFGRNPEVVAVFPQLSATVQTSSQLIRITRGDACDIAVQVQDDQDPPDPVSLSRSLLRFGVGGTRGGTPTNDMLSILKSSSDPSEIEISNEPRGQALVHLRQSDTKDLTLGDLTLRWDLKMTKAIEELDVPEGSTVTTTEASSVLFSPENLWTSIGLAEGDLLQVSERLVRVVSILNAAQVKVDFDGWQNASGVTFSAFRALTKTVAAGHFEATPDVVV